MPLALLSGKGQRGVVAVYLISNGRSSSRRIAWHGCLVEHPYHAFGRDLLKAKDNAGGWLRNMRPAVGIQAREIEIW
jgi:hypothetical protein